MYIDTVTITGADDHVDRNALYELSDEFPFVEWGILYNRGKEGTPRYPSDKWIGRFDRYAPDFVRRSVHLCGESATEFCDGDLSVARDAAYHSPRYDRLQVNIHESIRRGDAPFGKVADLLITSNSVISTIIQFNDITRPYVHALSKRENGNYVQILFDESRGKGIRSPIPPITRNSDLYTVLKTTKCGFAGGISPDNVEDVVKEVREVSNAHYMVRGKFGNFGSPPCTWIDMESGVRTDNEFDLEKVRDVLVKVRKLA